MARGDSVIRVSIIGDVKGLQKSLKTADTQLGKFGVSLKGIATGIGALTVANNVVGFLQDATREGDRLGDAMERLDNQLGPTFAKQIEDISGNFVKLGLSKQDVDELAANFADLATSLKIADPLIAGFAPGVVATAQALSLLGKGDTATLVDQIGKAAGGSAKAAKSLGVSLLSGVDPATQLTNILKQLAPALDNATTGMGDLEQKQSEVQARIETLQGEIGTKLNPVLADLLSIAVEITDELGDWPGAIRDISSRLIPFEMQIAAPFARLNDLLGQVGRSIDNINNALGGSIGGTGVGNILGGGTSESQLAGAIRRQQERAGRGGVP